MHYIYCTMTHVQAAFSVIYTSFYLPIPVVETLSFSRYPWLRNRLVLLRAGIRRVVAALQAASDVHPGKSNVVTARIAAENIVVISIALHRAHNVLKQDVGDVNPVGRHSRGAAVEVILLDVQTVVADVEHGDVAIDNVGHRPGRVGVGLDAHAVLRVEHHAVLEQDAVDRVVGFAADGPDRQAMAARAVHVGHGDLGAGRHGYTVVLVVHGNVAQRDVVGGTNIKPVRVVRCGQAIADGVGGVTCTVIQEEVGEGEVLVGGHIEQVCRPVHNNQVSEGRVRGVLNNKEMVRLDRAAVRAQSIPVG